MRVAKRKLNRGGGVLGLSRRLHDCSAAAKLGHMWADHSIVDNSGALYGPHQVPKTLSEDERRQAIGALVDQFREICIYYVGHTDILGSAIHRDQCEEELKQLGGHFYFKNIEVVRQFLKSHRILIPVLTEVRQKVAQYFGSETLSNLELFIDPEDNPSEPILFALILTTLPATEATTRLAQLDDEWWLDQPHDVRRLMNIDVEYVNGRV